MADELPPPVPKVGQYLYASCSTEYFGPILAVGQDVNGHPTIDLQVDDINAFIACRWRDEGDMDHSLMRVEHQGPVIFRALQYKDCHRYQYTSPFLKNVLGVEEMVSITCNTPGDGCHRCTSLFSLRDKPA